MAQIVVEMTARELAVWRAQQRLLEQLGKMDEGYTRLGQSAGQTARKASQGWDTSKILGFAGALAGGIGVSLSVVGALRAVIGWAEEAQEEVKGVAEALQQSYTGMKNIWQVSENVQQYQQLGAQYRLAMAREGISRQQAQDLTFFLKSAGKEEALPTVAMSARFMDPDVAAKWFATATAEINWGKEAGTPEQVLSALIAGAARSKFATGETAEWALRAAPMYAAQGVSMGEMLGVGAQMSWAAAGPEQLATYMLALQKQLGEFAQKQGLSPEARADFIGLFERYRAAGGLEPLREEMLGELKRQGISEGDVRFQRAVTALSRGLDQVRVDVGAVTEAAKTDAEFRRMTEARPPELSLHQAQEVARIQKEVMMEPLARRQIELQTAIDRMQALSAAAGRPVTVEKGWQKALEKEATWGMVEEATQRANQRFVEILRSEFPEVYVQGIKQAFPEFKTGGISYGGDYGVAPERAGNVIPARLSPAQAEAINRAMEQVAGQRIYQQSGLEQPRPPIVPRGPFPSDRYTERPAQPMIAPPAAQPPPLPPEVYRERPPDLAVAPAIPAARRELPPEVYRERAPQPIVPAAGGDGAAAAPRPPAFGAPTPRPQPARLQTEVVLPDARDLARAAEQMNEAAGRQLEAADRMEATARRLEQNGPPGRLGQGPARPVKK